MWPVFPGNICSLPFWEPLLMMTARPHFSTMMSWGHGLPTEPIPVPFQETDSREE
ncbi:hypothetical protein M5D96_007905, partial [Drosophila gunungcola]